MHRDDTERQWYHILPISGNFVVQARDRLYPEHIPNTIGGLEQDKTSMNLAGQVSNAE